jgi:hypothetical protein
VRYRLGDFICLKTINHFGSLHPPLMRGCKLSKMDSANQGTLETSERLQLLISITTRKEISFTNSSLLVKYPAGEVVTGAVYEFVNSLPRVRVLAAA